MPILQWLVQAFCLDSVYTYLTITVGRGAGSNYLLDPTAPTRIGRGAECAIVLTDALSSRVHAVVSRQPDGWRVHDAQSRNGTFVNGQKIDQAVLAEGHHLRVGSTEFAFHQSAQPPTVGTAPGINLTQTLIRDTRVGMLDSGSFALAAIQDSEQAKELLLLYQLSIKLLGCSEADEVMQVALDLVRDRCAASVVGFLWAGDDGRLRPKIVIPEHAAAQVTLSEPLTRLVLQEGHAVWIANQRSAMAASPVEHYADALCVPLVRSATVLGAIHVYLDQGRFRQSHFDFVISVANITTVALVRVRKQTALATDVARLKASLPGYDDMIGESPAMLDLKTRIGRVSQAGGCVLIRGESGSGKELVARAVHRLSQRADGPLLSVNCAAIPANLMESELFGHKAGSFTGAERDRVGLFEQADMGTLFLDEVGELSLAGQAKLLRILEGHPFMPLGGTNELSVDVRVIAATNRDLLSYVAEKKFREDLYYRLSVFELAVPPLRERGDDVELLIDFFLDHFARQHGRPKLRLAPEARQKLIGARWPGNVRQLRNTIDSAVVLAGGDQIQVDDLGLRDVNEPKWESLRIDYWEKKLIEEALARTQGNVPEAARLLGLSRATLYRKIDDYGVRR